MGLLDDLTSASGKLGQAAGQPAGAAPTSALVSEVLAVIQNREGGLSGLVQSFQQNGLGHLIQSWIGTGQNLPVSPAQIQSSLGAACTAKIAAATGLPQAQVESHLATLLPQIIDHLSPNGQLPQGGEIGGLLGGLAQRFLRT